MKKEEKKQKVKKNFRLLLPWIPALAAIIIANVSFGIYAADINQPESKQESYVTDIYDVELVKQEVPSGENESIVGVTRTELEQSDGKQNTKNLFNKDYYSLLENNENYSSLFEDIYHSYLRIFLNEKVGIDTVASTEYNTLTDLNYDLSTPRVTRLAAQVRALENLYYANLFTRRAIVKEGENFSFTSEMNTFIDKFYSMFRPVKVQTLFVPFSNPLYNKPYNYKNGEDVETIYEKNTTFGASDLFDEEALTNINGILVGLKDSANYVAEKNVSNFQELFTNLYSDYSTIINTIISENVNEEITSLDRLLEGSGYLTLSSQTFDQRLKSYSGSFVSSQTNHSLVNTYLALDSMNLNNNTLELKNQRCDDLAVNYQAGDQIFDPTISSTSDKEDNVNAFINQNIKNITIAGTEKRILSPCFSVMEINLGNEKQQVITTASNYGFHFTIASENNKRMTNSDTFKKVFKENILNDLKACASVDLKVSEDCDKAVANLLPTFEKTKYLPLISKDIFENLNIVEANAREIFENYQRNIKGSFNGYGISIFKQIAEFMSFETGSAIGLPLEMDFNEFANGERWKGEQ